MFHNLDAPKLEAVLEGGSNSRQGTVRITGQLNATICDWGWRESQARVVCRMLGLP